MIDRAVVQKALKHSWAFDDDPGWPDLADGQDSVTSFLVYDIFGGEILKTHKKNGWHFYNRIEGERIDFTSSEIDKISKNIVFEDLPSSPDETYNYFEDEEYSTLFFRFIRAYEEAVGLERFSPDIVIA